MDARDAKNTKLAELKASLMAVEGTPTEVYSRIVGYYRSVRNWNAGKREEFGRRREYEFPRTVPAAPQGLYSGAYSASVSDRLELDASQGEPARGTVVSQAGSAASWLLFTRNSCPNCPPVSAVIQASALPGSVIDVDTAEGMALAGGYDVLATPTVILLSAVGQEVGRAYTRAQLLPFLAPVRETARV